MSIDTNSVKDLAWAKQRLAGDVDSQGNLHNGLWYISYIKGSDNVCLDGEFDADDLLAISIYMREER